MGKELAAITGATGSSSGRVLQLLLEQDCSVRIVVRSDSKQENLLSVHE